MSLDPVSIALTVASTALQGMQQRSVEKRQRNLADAMGAYRAQKAGEGRAAINQFLDTIQPGAKDSERTAIVKELEGSLSDSVGAVRRFEAPQNIAGKVSPDYEARRASNDQTLTETLKRAIGQLSVIGAPGQQGMREATRYGRTAGEVDAANTASNNVSAHYMQGIQSQAPNPFLSLASQLAQGASFGRAMLGGAATPKYAASAPKLF